MKNINIRKILIIGGGRWGEVHYKELSKFKKLIRIDIFTIYNRDNLVKYKNSKTKIISNIKNLKKINYDLICIITKINKFKYYLEKFKLSNKTVLCEKPFLLGLNYFNEYNKVNKKFFLSSPWLYNSNLSSIKNKISDEKFDIINFFWYEKKSHSKYGKTKNFDTSIFFIEDILIHLLSIIYKISKDTFNLILKSRFNNFEISNTVEKIYNNSANRKIKFLCSRNCLYNKRILILKNDKNIYSIKFNLNQINVTKNKEKILSLKENKNEIYIQYKNILLGHKKNNIKFISNYINKTDEIRKIIYD